MQPLDAVIFGVPLVALTAAGVEALKQGFGLASKRAPIAAVCVAAILTALNALRLGLMPSPQLGAEWVLLGVVYGLAASGLYDHAEGLLPWVKRSPEVSDGRPSNPTHYHPGNEGRSCR